MQVPISIDEPSVCSIVTCMAEAHTVVSVGPYIFHNAAQRGKSCRARSHVIASPPHQMRKCCGSPCQPAALNEVIDQYTKS